MVEGTHGLHLIRGLENFLKGMREALFHQPVDGMRLLMKSCVSARKEGMFHLPGTCPCLKPQAQGLCGLQYQDCCYPPCVFVLQVPD